MDKKDTTYNDRLRQFVSSINSKISEFKKSENSVEEAKLLIDEITSELKSFGFLVNEKFIERKEKIAFALLKDEDFSLEKLLNICDDTLQRYIEFKPWSF